MEEKQVPYRSPLMKCADVLNRLCSRKEILSSLAEIDELYGSEGSTYYARLWHLCQVERDAMDQLKKVFGMEPSVEDDACANLEAGCRYILENGFDENVEPHGHHVPQHLIAVLIHLDLEYQETYPKEYQNRYQERSSRTRKKNDEGESGGEINANYGQYVEGKGERGFTNFTAYGHVEEKEYKKEREERKEKRPPKPLTAAPKDARTRRQLDRRENVRKTEQGVFRQKSIAAMKEVLHTNEAKAPLRLVTRDGRTLKIDGAFTLADLHRVVGVDEGTADRLAGTGLAYLRASRKGKPDHSLVLDPEMIEYQRRMLARIREHRDTEVLKKTEIPSLVFHFCIIGGTVFLYNTQDQQAGTKILLAMGEGHTFAMTPGRILYVRKQDGAGASIEVMMKLGQYINDDAHQPLPMPLLGE